MFNLKKIHTILGLILIVPLLAWAFTGLIFLIKPGYSQAYEQLSLQLYPIDQHDIALPEKPWIEVRLLKTILGHHLLVKSDNTWQHLDPITFMPPPCQVKTIKYAYYTMQLRKIATDMGI